jgi:hypothetical protein
VELHRQVQIIARWAGRMEGIMRIIARAALAVAAVAALLGVQAGAARAEQCQRFGGWGTGALEGFASFMAEAAMKNAAKAKFGDTVKIGPVSKKCEVPNLLYECKAFARACK